METVMRLNSFASGEWYQGDGNYVPLVNAVNGEFVAESSSSGLDFKSMLEYGRSRGGPALRNMTFHRVGRKYPLYDI